MSFFIEALVFFVALQHGFFLVLEMFLWDKPLGRKIFGLSKEQAAQTKVLASNQGLYNGFLALGLLIGIFSETVGFEFKVFFLSCVVVAGFFGAITVNKKILWVQGIPGAIALSFVLLTNL